MIAPSGTAGMQRPPTRWRSHSRLRPPLAASLCAALLAGCAATPPTPVYPGVPPPYNPYQGALIGAAIGGLLGTGGAASARIGAGATSYAAAEAAARQALEAARRSAEAARAAAETARAAAASPGAGAAAVTNATKAAEAAVAAESAEAAAAFAAARATQQAREAEAATARLKYVRVARAALYHNDQDTGSFAVFSYLIAAQKDPTAPVGQRLRAAIEAWAREAPYCPSDQVDPARIDVFEIPVLTDRPPDAAHSLCASPDSVTDRLLADYDTGRASALADRAGLDGQGPYLVASLTPLATLAADGRRGLLIWDISAIEPRLVGLAVDEFIRSANHPGDWDKTSLRRWALELRNWIAVGSQGWTLSREAAAAAIKGPE
jgi:hypothetical protein